MVGRERAGGALGSGSVGSGRVVRSGAVTGREGAVDAGVVGA